MKRTSFSRVLTALSAAAIALSVSSCVDPTYYPSGVEPLKSNSDGAKFKLDLERAIQASDRIVVLQHSHAKDFTGVVSNVSKAPYYSYGSRVLSSSAKADFLARVNRLSAYNSRASKREFEPHHTIKFYSGRSLKSTMRVSFGINEVRWNGSKYSAPQDIMRAIGPVISNAGFSSSRDWNGLARLEYANGRRSSSGTIGAVGGTTQTSPTRPTVRPPTSPTVTPRTPTPLPAPTPPVKPSVPTAKAVPGKPGTVFNPFTNNHVDVNGIPSGTKVRDPNDSNQSHIFKVP